MIAPDEMSDNLSNNSSDGLSELLSSVKAGDVIAFEELSEAYAPLINSEVSRVVSVNGELWVACDAEDLRQEALLALYKSACSYKENDKVSFGLYAKICIHNCLVTVAKRLTRESLKLDLTDPLGDTVLEDTEDPEASPEMFLVASERMNEIQNFIENQLTGYERQVFALHLAHKTYAQIATELDRDVKSVANALTRVREKFRNREF